MIPDTRLIAKRFNQRASEYHGLSPIQEQMAQDLLGLLPEDCVPNSVLEIGCGTGHLTRHLNQCFPDATIVATDIAENMLTVAADLAPTAKNITWLQADADLLAAHPHEPPPDLIVGNAVLQWLPNPVDTIIAFTNQLPPGGHLAFATFGPSTFSELQTLLSQHGIRHPLSSLPSASEWRKSLGAQSAIVHSDEYVHYAAGAKAFLRDTARSGAALPTARLAHATLRQLIEDYDCQATPHGIPVTWERIFIIVSA